MLFILKDSLSIEDKKLFKAYRSVCLSVPQSHKKQGTLMQCENFNKLPVFFNDY